MTPIKSSEWWEQMDLSGLYGHPIWARAVHSVLSSAHEHLHKMFMYYSKAIDPRKALNGLSLGYDELVLFLNDCNILNDKFTAERLQQVLRESLRVRDLTTMALSFPQFLHALVAMSFDRANPDGPPSAVEKPSAEKGRFTPFPDCLQLLMHLVLPSGKRDTSLEEREALLQNLDGQSALASNGMLIQELYYQLQTDTDRGVGLLPLNKKLLESGVLGEVRVKIPAPRSGIPSRKITTNMDSQNITLAFVNSRVDADAQLLGLTEFKECLLRIADVRFANVEEMDLGARLKGLVSALMEEISVAQVIFLSTKPRLDRTQAPEVPEGPLAQEWSECWSQLDLSGVYGFPLWEADVHNLLLANYDPLCAVFLAYAAPSKPGCPTMLQITMVERLLRDSKVWPNPAISSRNLIETMVKGGICGPGVEPPPYNLPAMLELFVKLSFHLANPMHGESGNASDDQEDRPLPECLEKMLNQYILKKAKRDYALLKRDRLANVKERAIVFHDLEEQLKSLFAELVMQSTTPENVTVNAPGVSPVVFNKLLVDAGLMGKTTVKRRAGIAGDKSREKVEIGVTAQQAGRLYNSALGARLMLIREGTMIFLSYADFKEAIVHVATSAYVQVVEMDDATALKATIKNMLQHEKPTLSVAASALDGQTGRVNVWRDSQQLPNESRSDYQVWVNTWHNIDISGVPGFPEWEREVHDMLHISFIQLMSIFSYYSKSRTRNNMVAAKSLDSGEFTSFCRDVKMFNSKFDELRGSDLFQKCANANSSDPKHAKAEELEPKHRLLLADFLRLLVEISFHRANPSYQPTGKAEDVVAPLPDCLNKLLHEVVLPNAKQDNAPSFRRRFSSDSKAQDVVHARAEDINRLWKALSGGNTQGVGIDAFLSFASKRQLMPTCEVYVSDEHVRPPTNKNKRIYRSSLSLEHARIAFIDSEASDLTLEGAGTAQAINTFLNLQEFTEALARMGDKKYELIEQMQLSDRIEAFLSNVFEGVATEDSIRAFIAPPPPRFDPGKRCNALKGETAEELQHFVHCWSCIKMHDIHGFPHFEESVCEVLHLHFKLLLATFAFYAGISGDTSATKIEAVGLRNLSTSQWIEFVKVSNICTRSFEQHRAVNAFHASRTGGSDVMPPNSSNESSCTFPEFLSALLRVSFWRANPLFAESRSLVEVGLVHSEAQAEAALVPLGECFPKLLTTNVLPRAKRANMRVRWLSMISSESMVSALLPTLLRELKAVYAVIFDKNFEDATKTEKEDARGQLEVTPVDHVTQLPIERVIRLLEKTKVIGRTEVKQDTGVTPMPNETPVIFVADLPERVARQLLIDSYHAVMANATPTVLTPNPPLIEIGRAQLQEFVCCASEVKYSALHEHMPLLNRLRSLLLNMLGKEFPHDTIAKAIRTEGPKRIDATAMVKQLHVLGTGAEGEFMQELWLAAWQRLRLNVLPGFPLWEQEVFRCFATDFCEVIYPVYLFYCRCKSDSCATVVRGRSLGIEEWLQFCSDCRLVTRNFDLPALRKLHGQCVPNTPDDGLLEARLLLPDFMTALTMLSFKRNNASWLKALPPDTLPPRPLPGCLIEVLQSNVVPHARRDPTSNLLKSLKQAPKVMELLEEHNGSLQELHKSLWVSSSSSPRVKAVEMQKVLSMLKAKRIFAVQHVQQKSAVTGDPDCMVVHKSTLDNATAARCFVAASRATFFRTDEAVATRGLLVFDEFLDFLMLLANAKYGDIAGMEPATQLKALIQNLIGVADTKAAIEEATFKSLSTTFNPRSGCKTDGTESTEEYEHWLACWDKVRLNQVIGFPLWLGDVHDILHSSLEQLRLIFGYYSKLPSTTAMPSTAMPSITATPSMTPMPEPPLLTLDMQKLMVLARDTSLLRKSFDDTKLSAIAKNYFTSIAEHGLNQGQMLFPDFLSLLVHVAFVRFNPRVTMNATKFPHIGEGAVIDAPVALCRLLDEVIFPDAKQDDRFLFRQRISAAPGELGDVIARRRNDLEDMFKKCCSMNSVPLHAALSFMTSREVLKDVAVQQRSAITADEARLTVHHSTLNVSHVRRAFTDSLPEEALRLCELDMLSETSTKLQLGQESFLEFVARCAMAKYGSVKGMGLPQMLDGFLDNLLKKRDEVEVIHAATDIPMPPRFDPFSEQNLLLPGEEKSEFDAWTMCWIVVRLEELPGFPVWERDVYDILHGEFVRLCQIFDVYCKSAGEDDEDAFAMNVNEWSFFCREIRISTKLFSLGRAESIFRYSMAPESNELMLPQFIEAIVHLAFQRFNPDLIRRPMYEARASKHVSVIDALKKLLQEHIFAHARQEDPNSFLRLLNEDKQALFVIKEYSTPIFRMLKLEGYLREGTDDRMEFAEALELAKKRNVLGFHNIEVQGSRPIVASLSEPQLRHSFLNARGGAAARVLGVDTLVGMEIMHMFAQCGDIAFSAVSKSTLHKRIEAFFQVLLHSADMQHVLLELGQRGLPPRFEAKKALTLLLDESVDEHEEWGAQLFRIEPLANANPLFRERQLHAHFSSFAAVQIFKSLSLHSLPGFPSWEQNIYNLLHGHWKELLSIFIFYCKKEKVTTSSAEVGLRLSAAGWLALIKQAQLAVPQKFEATAFLQLFFKVATGVVGMPEEPTEVLSELLYVWEQASQLRAVTETIDFCSFVELLIHASHARANPIKITPDPLRRLIPLPKCVEDSVCKLVLTHCQRDDSYQLRGAILEDRDLQDMLSERQSQVRDLWAKAKEGGHGSREDMLQVQELKKLFEKAKVFRSLVVPHKTTVTGDPWSRTTYSTSFGEVDMCECFLESCSPLQKVATVPSLMSSVEEIARHSFDMYFQVEAEQPQTYSTPKIAFESFGEFLSRCGLVKYAKVPMMTTRDKVAAFLDNLTNKCDEETVIANATEQTTPPVFDAVKESVALLGEPEAQFAHWLACWKQLRLSSLFGFPLWLRELHEYLHQHFRQLHMIFAFYGIIKDEEPTLSSTLLLGMQEWLALARDCRLTTPEFTTHDLKDVFHQVASRSSEIALPGMIEALVRVSMLRANPSVEGLVSGNVPSTLNGLQLLPGCLIHLMEQYILPLARQDTQLFLPEKLKTDQEAQSILRKRQTELRALMAMWNRSSTKDPKFISLSGVMQIFTNAGLIRTWSVPQASEITGDPACFTTYTLSLSPADIRVAFVNSASPDRMLQGKITYTTATGKNKITPSMWTLNIAKGGMPAPHVAPPRDISDGPTDLAERLLEAFSSKPNSGQSSAQALLLEFEEFEICLVRCACKVFSGLPSESMTLALMVQALLSAIESVEDIATAARRACMIRAPPQSTGNPKLPMPGESDSTRGCFFRVWERVDLHNIHGYPLWINDVFETLRLNFVALTDIFSAYCEDSPPSIMTKNGWVAFLLGAQITQSASLSQFCDLAFDEVYEPEIGGIRVHGFFRLLCEVAFMRANPNYDCALPYELPLTLKAREHRLVSTRRALQPVTQVVDALQRFLLELNDTLLSTIFATPTVLQRRILRFNRKVKIIIAVARPLLGNIFSTVSSADSLDLNKFIVFLRSKGLLENFVEPFALHVDDVRLEFERCVGPDVDGTSAVGFASFEELVFRLGGLYYGSIEHMSIEDRTAAICLNMFGGLTPTDAVESRESIASKFLAMHFSAEDVGEKATRLPNESASDLALWGRSWSAVDLTSISDFPACEEPIHNILHTSFHQLRAVYMAYADAQAGLLEGGWKEFLEDIGIPYEDGIPAIYYRLSRATAFSACELVSIGKTRVGLNLPQYLEALIWVTVQNVCAQGHTPTGNLLCKRLQRFIVDSVFPNARADPLTATIHQVLGDEDVLSHIQSRLTTMRQYVSRNVLGKSNTFSSKVTLPFMEALNVLGPIIHAREAIPLESDVTEDPICDDRVDAGLSDAEAGACLWAIFDADMPDAREDDTTLEDKGPMKLSLKDDERHHSAMSLFKDSLNSLLTEASLKESFKEHVVRGMPVHSVGRESVNVKGPFKGSSLRVSSFKAWLISESGAVIDSNQLVKAVALCGQLIFANVEQMNISHRAAAALRILLDGSTVRDEVTSMTAIRVVRTPINIRPVDALNETSSQMRMWAAIWSGVNLKPVQGFPLWEADAHMIYRKSWVTLMDMYSAFCPPDQSPPLHKALNRKRFLMMLADCGATKTERGMQVASAAFSHVAIQHGNDTEKYLLFPHFLAALALVSLGASATWKQASHADVIASNPYVESIGSTFNGTPAVPMLRLPPRVPPAVRPGVHWQPPPPRSMMCPMPVCLDKLVALMVRSNVAKRTSSAEVRELATSNAAKTIFEASHAKSLLRALPDLSTSSGVQAMVSLMQEKGLCSTFQVQRESSVTADPRTLKVFSASLTSEDIVLSIARSTSPLLVSHQGTFEPAEMSHAPLLETLIRISLVLYAELEDVDNQTKLKSLIQNLEQKISVSDVIKQNTYIHSPLPFVPAESSKPDTMPARPWMRWLSVWKKMEFSEIPLYPLWEREVYDILLHHFNTLTAIFQHYAHSEDINSQNDSGPLDPESMTMTPSDWIAFVRDVQMETTAFPAKRAIGIFEHLFSADQQMLLHHFLQLLLRAAFQRANPKYIDARSELHIQLPEALKMLLNQSILPLAKRDNASLQHLEVGSNPSIKTTLEMHAAKLRYLFEANADLNPPSVFRSRLMSKQRFLDILTDNGCTQTVSAPQASEITADPAVMRHVTLPSFYEGAQRAFHECAKARAADYFALKRQPFSSQPALDVHAYLDCIALCSQLRFIAIGDRMSPAQRVSAFVRNLLQESLAESEVSAATIIRAPPRFDAAQCSVPSGELVSQHNLWLRCWKRMDLSPIPGFPIWEKIIYNTLQPQFDNIYCIFAYHARLGNINGFSAAFRTIELSEWENFIQVADGPVEYARKTFVMVVGDPSRSMQLPHFMSALCRICYMAAAAKPRQTIAADALELQLLPWSLPFFLRTLLMKAGKDELATFRITVFKDSAVQAVLATHSSFIDSLGPRGHGSMKVSLSMAKKILSRVVRRVEAHRVSEITADPLGGTVYRSIFEEKDIDAAFLESMPMLEESTSIQAEPTLNDDEFREMLVRCAHMKYSDVPMTSGARVEGLLLNLRGQADEAKVIVEATKIRAPPRYKPVEGDLSSIEGESLEDLRGALDVWSSLQLFYLPAFPIWEMELFNMIRQHFAKLRDIFEAYAPVHRDGNFLYGARTINVQEWLEFVESCELLPTAERRLAEESFAQACYNCPPKKEAGSRVGEAGLAGFIQAIITLACKVNGEQVQVPKSFHKLLMQVIQVAECSKPDDVRADINNDPALQQMLIMYSSRITDIYEKSCEHNTATSKLIRFVQSKATSAVKGVSLQGATAMLANYPPKLICRWFAESMRISKRAPFPGGGVARRTGQLLKRNEFMEFLCRTARSKVTQGSLARPFSVLMRELSGDQRSADDNPTSWSQKKPVAFETKAELRQWLNCFSQVELTSLPGYPTWEQQVHDMLHAGFVQLEGVFDYACGPREALGLEDWLKLLDTIGLLDRPIEELSTVEARTRGPSRDHDQWGMQYQQKIVAHLTHANDDEEYYGYEHEKSKLTSELRNDKVLRWQVSEEDATRIFDSFSWVSNSSLRTLPYFLSMLPYLSQHIFSKYSTEKVELSDALQTLLDECIYVRAPVDARCAYRLQLKNDQQLRNALTEHESELKDLFDQLKGESLGISCEQLVSLLQERSLLSETKVRRLSEITADAATKQVYECELGVAQVQHAFSQTLPRGAEQILTSVGQLAECLGRCGGMTYMLVDPMPLSLMASGFVKNVLDLLTVEELVTEATLVRAPPRFQPEALNRLAGESINNFQSMIRCWSAMKLNGLPDWPRWEQDVYQLMRPVFRWLGEIFLHLADPAEAEQQPPRMSLASWLRFCNGQKLISSDFTEEAASITFTMALQAAASQSTEVKGVDVVISPQAKVKHRVQVAREAGRKVEAPSLDQLTGATLPEFLSAFFAGTFWSANPNWRAGSADTISVPNALRHKLAEQAVHHLFDNVRTQTPGFGETSADGNALTPRIQACLVHLPQVTTEGLLAESEVAVDDHTDEEIRSSSRRKSGKRRGKVRPRMKQSQYESLMAELTSSANDISPDEQEELKKRLQALQPGNSPPLSRGGSPRRKSGTKDGTQSPQRSSRSSSRRSGHPQRLSGNTEKTASHAPHADEHSLRKVSFGASSSATSSKKASGNQHTGKHISDSEDDGKGTDGATVEGWGDDGGAGAGRSLARGHKKDEGDMAAARARVAARIAATLERYESDEEDDNEFVKRGRKTKKRVSRSRSRSPDEKDSSDGSPGKSRPKNSGKRSFHHYKYSKRAHRAATKLQSYVRGRQARKRVLKMYEFLYMVPLFYRLDQQKETDMRRKRGKKASKKPSSGRSLKQSAGRSLKSSPEDSPKRWRGPPKERKL